MSNNKNMNENPSETKILMADALKRLIKDRPFTKITVQDIVAECNINRNTFYYHFENNYDLLYFAYEQEVQNIANSFRNANATIPQAMDFILEYIDNNISLCMCAYESLGEQQLKNIFEKDLHDFVRITIDFFSSQHSISFSEDFKSFASFSYTNLLSTQIIWYIKHNSNLDKLIFKDNIQTFFLTSLKSVLEEAAKKGM
ncbi:MAG: TetR/AcrR family transcriptional regulator [Treponema sp.]|nr:TetR/AcrR family transcriptional regulator [Treponema sp.]